MEDRKPLDEIGNPDARLDELEYRLEHGSREEALRASLESLADPYPPLRHRATSALAARVDSTLANLFGAVVLEDEEALGRALADLPFDAPPDIPFTSPLRQAACRILAQTTGEATESILEQAASDADPDVRYQALIALHRLDLPGEMLERIVGPRLQDADSEVATVAAQICAERGLTDFADAIAAIRRRAAPSDRLQFAIALAELVGEHGAEIDEETFEEVYGELTDALDDGETIAGAARALVHLGSERAAAPLRDILDRWFVHPLLRVEAAGALIELDDERGAQYLCKALEHRRKDVRGYALRTVGRLQLDEHLDRLVETAEAGGYHADTAVIALAQFGSDAAMQALERLADSPPDDELGRLAERVLFQRRKLADFDPEQFEFM